MNIRPDQLIEAVKFLQQDVTKIINNITELKEELEKLKTKVKILGNRPDYPSVDG